MNLELPKITDPQQATEIVGLILEAAGRGDITVEQAEGLVRILETQTRLFESQDLARRIVELEKQLPPARSGAGPEKVLDPESHPVIGALRPLLKAAGDLAPQAEKECPLKPGDPGASQN